MNVAYLENNKPVAAYIDFDGMIETIVELMTDEREGFGENDFETDCFFLDFRSFLWSL